MLKPGLPPAYAPGYSISGCSEKSAEESSKQNRTEQMAPIIRGMPNDSTDHEVTIFIM